MFASILIIASCTSPVDTGRSSSSDKAAGRQLSYKAGTVPKTAADSSFTNPLTQSDVPDDTGTVTYTSSDKAVATVDEKSGEVTIVTAGETTITATKAATAKYAESTARYVLTVTLAEGVQLSYKVNAVLKETSGRFTNPLTVSDVLDDKGAITYMSSLPEVARVNSDTGEVNIIKLTPPSIVVITATKAATEKYAASKAGYVLSIGSL